MNRSQLKGRFSFIRASSVLSVTSLFASWRLRFALFDCSKWRRPAWLCSTLPEAVTLKRLATAFFVLRLAIGFGIESPESISAMSIGNQNFSDIHISRLFRAQSCTGKALRRSSPRVQCALPIRAPTFPVQGV